MTKIVIRALSASKKQPSKKKAALAKAKSTKAKTAKAKSSKAASSSKFVERKDATRGWKIVTGFDGTRVTVHTVNADSKTFDRELSEAFKKSVATARKENRELTRSGRGASKN